MRWILPFFIFLLGCQSESTMVVAYQGMANPWKSLIKTGKLEKMGSQKTEFKKFNSGAKVISALASGDIDVAVVGSTPLASALSQGLDLKVVWVMEVIGDSEALVAKKSVKDLKDLVGKKVGVPFGSTTHYHLMLALEKNKISEQQVEIFNLSPSAIVSSWKNNQIDAAFVWAPALQEIKSDGHVLLTSKELSDAGDPTFDALVVRGDYLAKHKKSVAALVKAINDLHTSLASKSLDEDNAVVNDIADFLGAKKQDVLFALSGYHFPLKDEQVSTQLLGGGLATALNKTSQFLKAQGKVSKTLGDYKPFIDPTLAQEI